MEAALAWAGTAPLVAFTLACLWALHLFDDIYVAWRQQRCIRTARVPPALAAVVDADALAKARHYALDRERFGMCRSVYGTVEVQPEGARRRGGGGGR